MKALLLILLLPGVLLATPVKRTDSGICHDVYSSWYSRVKSFVPYDSLDACLEDGGRLPKNYTGPGGNTSAEYSTLYDRKQWTHWIDEDGDCQDTRAETLISQTAEEIEYRDNKGCVVLSGVWYDPYSAQVWYEASELDIDHIVPLKWAHGHGGDVWSPEVKRQFANDPANLIAVEDNLNQTKGAKGPDEWLPPNEVFECAYVRMFDKIVRKYGLIYTSGEHVFVYDFLIECGE